MGASASAGRFPAKGNPSRPLWMAIPGRNGAISYHGLCEGNRDNRSFIASRRLWKEYGDSVETNFFNNPRKMPRMENYLSKVSGVNIHYWKCLLEIRVFSTAAR
jgi:hypothetical protein